MDFRCDACEITFECEDETYNGELNCPQCEALLRRVDPKPAQQLIPPGQNRQQDMPNLVPPGSGGSTLSLQQPQEPAATQPPVGHPVQEESQSNFSVFQNHTSAHEPQPQSNESAGFSVFQNAKKQRDKSCRECGNPLAPDAVLCVQCGTKVNGESLNKDSKPQLNYGPQQEFGAQIIGFTGKAMLGLLGIFALLFIYACFKNPPRVGVLPFLMLVGYVYFLVLKVALELMGCAFWLSDKPDSSFKFSCMFSTGKVLVYTGAAILFVPITMFVLVIYGFFQTNFQMRLPIGELMKEGSPWLAGGLILFFGGKAVTYMASDYRQDHIYDDKKAKIFKVIEMVLITFAIYFIAFMIVAQLSGITAGILRMNPMILIFWFMIGSTFLVWGAFYAYGAYSNLHAAEVIDRKPKLFILPVIYTVGCIFLVPWIISQLPYSWHSFDALKRSFTAEWQYYVFSLLVVTCAPVFEELAFRKNLLPGLIKTFGYWGAVLASSFAFAVAHGNLAQLFPGIFIGLVTGYVFLQSGRVLYCIFLHFIYNCGVLLIQVAAMKNWFTISKTLTLTLGFSLTIAGIVLILITHRPFEEDHETPKRRSSGKRRKKKTTLNLNRD